MLKSTRGFTGRNRGAQDLGLPPGQYDTGSNWPVLTAEPTPKLSTAEWSFAVEGLVEEPTTWTWDQIQALDPSTYHGPIQCVTTWSKLGMMFSGVSVDTLLEIARPLPSATHVLAVSHTGYTTNLPLADVTDGRAWVVWEVPSWPCSGSPAAPVGPTSSGSSSPSAHPGTSTTPPSCPVPRPPSFTPGATLAALPAHPDD